KNQWRALLPSRRSGKDSARSHLMARWRGQTFERANCKPLEGGQGGVDSLFEIAIIQYVQDVCSICSGLNCIIKWSTIEVNLNRNQSISAYQFSIKLLPIQG